VHRHGDGCLPHGNGYLDDQLDRDLLAEDVRPLFG